MKMDSTKLKNILKERLKDEGRTFKFDSKQDTLRVENVKTGKGSPSSCLLYLLTMKTYRKKRSMKLFITWKRP